MKINYGRYAVGALCTLLLAVSCEKDDSATKPQVPVKTVLASGGYWQEDVRFVYLDENRQIRVSEDNIVRDFHIDGGAGPNPEVELMGPYIHIYSTQSNIYNIDSYRIDFVNWYPNYAASTRFPKPLYYHPNYFQIQIYVDPEYNYNMIYVMHKPAYDKVYNENIMANNSSRPISITQDKMIWEVPIKSCIYSKWRLDGYTGRGVPYRKYLYIQVTWTRITDPDILEILAQTPTYEEYEKNKMESAQRN